MKIKFIPLMFILGFISGHSQITAANGAALYVSPNTELYSSGDVTVNDATSNIRVDGNLRVTNGGTVKNASSATNFTLGYNSDQQYGQLIVDSGVVASPDKITIEQKLVSTDPNANPTTDLQSFYYLGVPFQGYTLNDLANDINGSAVTAPTLTCAVGVRCKSASWNAHPIFVRDNTAVRHDPATGNLQAGRYYTVRSAVFSNGANLVGKLSFSGIPYVANTADNPVFYSRVDNNFNITGRDVYNINRFTYLQDPFRSDLTFNLSTTDADLNASNTNGAYMDNFMYLSNPFTSNLDLVTLAQNNTLVGIGYEGQADTSVNARTRSTIATTIIEADASGKLSLGDVDKGIIPPMRTFFVKAKSAGQTLDLASGQTFQYGNYTPPTLPGGGSRSISNFSVNNDTYQVNLQLLDTDSGDFYNHTYLGVNEGFKTGGNGEYESLNTSVKDNVTAIYTLPELETGGINPDKINTPLYINVMSAASEKVAIPVGISVNPEFGTKFTITARLSDNGKFLDKSQINFANPNAKFYFHDKLTGDVKLIDTNFKYTITLNETTKDRFEIYWKNTGIVVDNSNNSQEEIAKALDYTTAVYNSNNEYKVRFDSKWKSASVLVYSTLGQLISSEKNINTQNDYLLPIKGASSMYIVKIISDNGEVVTKKIVK